MKIKSYCTTAAVALLAFSSCQTPLYVAVRDNNSSAVKNYMASGADPYETSPENWWWKAPLLPVTISLDILFAGAEVAIGDYVTAHLVRYGSITPIEEAKSWTNWNSRQAEICYTLALSGRVYDYDFLHSCLSHAFRTSAYDKADQIMARGIPPLAADLSSVLQNNRYDYAELIMSKGVKPDSTHLRIVLDKNNYTFAEKLLRNGALMNHNMLIDAIKAGDVTKARFLVKHGMNVNAPLNENSYQFIAQEAGQLALYRSLGGVVVEQPVAPLVDCRRCDASGRVVSSRDFCLPCLGSGKQYSYTSSYTPNGYAGCDPNDPNNQGYSVNSEYIYYTCGNCDGEGSVKRYSNCPICNGKGKVSRYLRQ